MISLTQLLATRHSNLTQQLLNKDWSNTEDRCWDECRRFGHQHLVFRQLCHFKSCLLVTPQFQTALPPLLPADDCSCLQLSTWYKRYKSQQYRSWCYLFTRSLNWYIQSEFSSKQLASWQHLVSNILSHSKWHKGWIQKGWLYSSSSFKSPLLPSCRMLWVKSSFQVYKWFWRNFWRAYELNKVTPSDFWKESKVFKKSLRRIPFISLHQWKEKVSMMQVHLGSLIR